MKQKKLKTTRRIKRKGKYYTVVRDVKGRFVRFEKWKPPKTMWRLTVGINYAVHHVYRCFKLLLYLKNKKDIKNFPPTEQLTELLKNEFRKKTGYSVEELAACGSEITIGEEFRKIKYDPYIEFNEIMFKDEYLYKKKRRKR